MNWLNRFKRVTSSDQFIPEIDGFRFLAISTVVLMHARTNIVEHNERIQLALGKGPLNKFLLQGGLGVSVFFAISGFILALPFARAYLFGAKKIILSAYFTRRVTRLEPPYLVSLTVFFVVALLLGRMSLNSFDNYVASCFYVHHFIYNHWSYINPVTWSLETEVQFYILAPVVTIIFKWKNETLRRTTLGFFIFFAANFFFISPETLKQLHLLKSLMVFFQYFAVGILFADLYLTNRMYFTTKSRFWNLLGLIAHSLLFVYAGFKGHIYDFAFCIFLLLTFISVFKSPAFNYFYTRPWVVTIGGMCYSIYLLHYGILHFASDYLKYFVTEYPLFDFFIQMVISLVLVLVISAIFFLLVEKPAMNKKWPAELHAKWKNFLAKLQATSAKNFNRMKEN